VATPNPFDSFDEPNEFDRFDAAPPKSGRIANALNAAGGAYRRKRDQLQAQLNTIGTTPSPVRARGHGPIRALPEVTVTGTRPGPEPGWGELARDLPGQVAAQGALRISGATEYVGDTENRQAKKQLWQSIVLPYAVRESFKNKTAITEHPDVIHHARRLGIRPDHFVQGWPGIANLPDEELRAIRGDAVSRIAKSRETQARGKALRTEAAGVMQAYRPDLDPWSMKGIAFDAAASVPDLLAAAGVGMVAGPAAGAAVLGATTAPGYYAEAKQMGLEPSKAKVYSTLMALAEAAPELPVLSVLTSNPAAKATLRQSVGKYLAQATGHVATAALTEGVSEGVTEALQIAIEQGVIDKDIALPEALSRIARSGVVGSVMGGSVRLMTTGPELADEASTRLAARSASDSAPGLDARELVTETPSVYDNPFDAFDQPDATPGAGQDRSEAEDVASRRVARMPDNLSTEAPQGTVQGYTVEEATLDEAQRATFSRVGSGIQADQDVFRTLGGGRPSAKWLEAARGAGAGNVPRYYRGSRSPLTPDKFAREALGHATGHPTSGIGVFFSNRREDAARFGSHIEEVHLDLQNPKTIKAEDLPPFDTIDDAHAWRERLREQGHDGVIIDASHLGGPVWPVAFAPEQVIRGRNEFDRFDSPDVQRSSDVQAMAGAQYVPLLQARPVPQSATVTIAPGTAFERTAKLPKEPIRREHVMKEFQRLFGVKVYQGAPFRVRRALGYFRPKTGEVRVRRFNDLEVTAHEVFHWIDRNYQSIRKLYREARFRDELKSVSYDEKLLFEGFAEFGRLFLTQPEKAAAKTPAFYQAFVSAAKTAGILDKLLTVQEHMTLWYRQGAEGRARSKIGTSPAPVRQRIADATDRIGDRILLQTLDALQGIKVVERELAGTIQDATVSPYKSARLVAGARGVAKAILNHGTVSWDQKGDLVFTGKGLRQIFDPVADVLDDAMAYFVGRRAAELADQGREKLFERDEIKALLAIADNSPKGREIEQTFGEYQAFLDRTLDFYEASGLISPRSRQFMREMNRDYVPFHRIVETLEKPDGIHPGGNFRRLRGGTQNLRDVFENIVGSVQALTSAALHNRTKQQLYQLIESSKDGATFAVRVGTTQHATRIDPDWLVRKVNALIDDNGLAKAAVAAMSANPAFGEQLLYWSGKYAPSAPDLDFVLVNGEPRYYQVGDPLLMETLQQFNTLKPTGLALRILGGFSNTLRRGVTLALDFQIPNLIRDSFNAFALSRGGQFPLVDSIRGMVARLRNNADYWDFLANGGGFSSQIHGETKALKTRLERYYSARKIDYRTVLDTPQKLLDAYDELASAFEYGTRVAEFRKLRAAGASRREAAYQGREISTDFAMRGASDFLRVFTVSVPFLNARLQGLYRLQREVFEKDGSQAFNAPQTKRFALRAILGVTLPSLVLWWLYHDDERYKALPEWLKLSHWVILGPGDKAFLIPKPFEVGALFATVPEQTLQQLGERNGPKYADAMGYLLANAFGLNPTPQAVKPLVDVASNRSWSGAPIVPESLQEVSAAEQFAPFTSETLIRAGRMFDVSPAKLEYLTRGYFGTLGQYALSASDALLDPSLETGAKPADSLADDYVIRRFVRASPYRGTSYEEEFYEVLDQTREAVATLRKIERDQRFSDVEKFLANAEKRTLIALSGQSVGGRKAGSGAEQVAEKASQITAAMNQVRLSPTLTAEQKRDALDKLQHEKNALFDAASTIFSRANVEALANER
jgi:hypothetical protein